MLEFYRLAAWRILDRQKVLSTAEIIGEKESPYPVEQGSVCSGKHGWEAVDASSLGGRVVEKLRMRVDKVAVAFLIAFFHLDLHRTEISRMPHSTPAPT
jgi:hypothetical protein